MGLLEDIAAAPTTPTYSTLDAARAKYPDLTVDEYALSRVVGSENFNGRPAELVCIADVTVNRAKRAKRSVHDYVTAGGEYGSQGSGGRSESSARPGGPRHIAAARAVLHPATFLGVPIPFLPPRGRGWSGGAVQYFDPGAQLASLDATHCHPLVILERWTYDLEKVGCELKREHRGPNQQEWVGPIAGVDPWVLMLLRPAGPNQDALYAEAKRIIETRGTYKGRAPLPLFELAAVAALAAGLKVGVLG